MITLSSFQVILFFIVIIIAHVVWAKRRIKQWALRNNYKIIKCNICLVNLGPFSYGFFFGLLRERVEVRWDKTLLDEYEYTK